MTDLLDPPVSEERPRIDPRIASRWIDARREEGRRRLHLLLGAGAVVFVAALAVGSLFTPLFAVRHERITVAGPLPAAEVARLAGIGHHPLTISVDAAAVARRLDADPWLGAARVDRHWPGTVTISVAVRSPLAVAARPAGGGWAEIDPTGRVLADVATPPPGVPMLQGVTAVPPPGSWLSGTPGPAAAPGAAAGSLVDMVAASDGDVPAGPAAALAFLQALPPLIRSDVLSINSAPGPGLSLVVSPPRTATGTVTVLLGDGSQLQSKVTALLAVLQQGNLSGVAGLDLSVPSRPATASSVAALTPAPPSPPASTPPASTPPASTPPASATTAPVSSGGSPSAGSTSGAAASGSPSAPATSAPPGSGTPASGTPASGTAGPAAPAAG